MGVEEIVEATEDELYHYVIALFNIYAHCTIFHPAVGVHLLGYFNYSF
jgi:hypothetical protein